jgi:HD-GYP domain-containing protein (c-di-GMP phosphodiesterase class II)
MLKISLIDVVTAFSSSIDMICPQLSDHNKRVAYIAYSIAVEMGMDKKERSDILIAGLLHDCGAIKDDEKLQAAQYDFGSTDEKNDHGYIGWKLLHEVKELENASEIIKFHHIYWNEHDSSFSNGESIPSGSYIVHLADRIDVLINRNEEILKQRTSIVSKISSDSGKMFMPDAVEAFLTLSEREYFWFDLMSGFLSQSLSQAMSSINIIVNEGKLLTIAQAFNKLIDYRSRFTAAHSIGVAACASMLSSKMNFSRSDIRMMTIAGLLHDLGKLAIPLSILEKRGPLNRDEFNIIKKHPYYTYRILDKIPQLEKIKQFAALHHERMDGKGYPFGIRGEELSLGSRIMAISDVYTALTEERPYRHALSPANAIIAINDMVGNKHLDGDVFDVFRLNLDEINQYKLNAQNRIVSDFYSSRLRLGNDGVFA